MRIAVDGRTLVKEGRGIARVTRGLLEALQRLFPEDEWLVYTAGGARRRVLSGAAAVAGRPRLDRLSGGEVDVVWLPEPAPVAISAGVPVVLTLHDLSFETRPQDFTHYERTWHRLARPRALASRAARVMAVSEATRTQAISRWALREDKVLVVRPGVDGLTPTCAEGAAAGGEARARGEPDADGAADAGAADAGLASARADEVRRRLGLPERYLLFVGALEPRKAPEVLAQAFAAARKDGLDAALVVVGEGRERATLAAAGAMLLGRLGDEELAALYAGALALVLPSRLEGCGLPPLEALAHGTPSVVSELPALRETLGDGALFVAPGDASGLACGLREIAADEALRTRLVARGRPRLARLTWGRAAREARAVLGAAAR